MITATTIARAERETVNLNFGPISIEQKVDAVFSKIKFEFLDILLAILTFGIYYFHIKAEVDFLMRDPTENEILPADINPFQRI